MRKVIAAYWPSYYEGIRDFQVIAGVEDAELEQALQAVEGQLQDRVVMTAREDAVKRRERMLGIQADPSKESLDFRRRRIVNRYSTKPPFTVRYLQQQLDRLVGKGMTVVSADAQQFVLYVTANIENAAIFQEVQHTVETVKPANLIYRQNTSLKDDIALEERIARREIYANYTLGSWRLGLEPFVSFGPEVAVK